MKKLLLASLVAAVAGYTAYADNTDNAAMGVDGTIIAALTITNNNDLTVPDLVTDPDAATSVAVACTNAGVASVTYSGNGNPYAHGIAAAPGLDVASANLLAGTGNEAATCGKLTVTGQTGYAYALTAPDPVAVSGVTVSGIACASVGNGTISATGTENELYCGATVTSAAATDAAAYDIASTITVTYD